MYYGEYLNSLSHLIGAVLSLIGLGALLAVSIQTGDPLVITAFTVFGTTLVLLYTMSTLYHSFRSPQLKQLFKVLDHISIYLLIAGTYTPLMLIAMPEETGLPILVAVWVLAILGTLSEIFMRGKLVKIIQMVIFLTMGWACTLDAGSLKTALTPIGFNCLLLGGLAYTGGVLFYVLDKLGRLNHAHGIWHAFVLVGSVAHFIVVIGYLR